uniref:Uncharacterized protein n=1 Tax=Anguilla anguilla TaxID=7936 RepID=A0A0E9R3S8_ANGAN
MSTTSSYSALSISRKNLQIQAVICKTLISLKCTFKKTCIHLHFINYF